MTEKSALDKIDEIHFMLESLHMKMDLLQKSLNILHNKSIDGNPQSISGLSHNTNVSSPSIMPIPPKANIVSGLNTQVSGKFYNSKNLPVVDASVKVTDQNNKLVKQIKTDIGGKWATNLPIGQYTIKYSKEGLPVSYRMVNIKEGQVAVEVI